MVAEHQVAAINRYPGLRVVQSHMVAELLSWQSCTSRRLRVVQSHMVAELNN